MQVFSGMLSLLRFGGLRLDLGGTRQFRSWGNYFKAHKGQLTLNESMTLVRPVRLECRRALHQSRIATFVGGLGLRRFGPFGNLVGPAVVFLSTGCCSSMAAVAATAAYTVAKSGSPNGLNYKVYIGTYLKLIIRYGN